jgi:hypothetical protein
MGIVVMKIETKKEAIRLPARLFAELARRVRNDN